MTLVWSHPALPKFATFVTRLARRKHGARLMHQLAFNSPGSTSWRAGRVAIAAVAFAARRAELAGVPSLMLMCFIK